jgi:hypothetical protein
MVMIMGGSLGELDYALEQFIEKYPSVEQIIYL